MLDESYGNDVQDELALELDDNPGPILGQMWLLITGTLVSITLSFAELAW